MLCFRDCRAEFSANLDSNGPEYKGLSVKSDTDHPKAFKTVQLLGSFRIYYI